MPCSITIIQGDITKIKADAIVNAANKTLLGGGGVDGIIHQVAGQELLEECKTLHGCETGEAKITKGYNLPARYVIHTVGPIYGTEHGQEAVLLASCYHNSLKLAEHYNLRSIAFPALSTGAYRYPKDEACHIALRTVTDFIHDNPDVFDEVIFVLFDELDFNLYTEGVHKTGSKKF